MTSEKRSQTRRSAATTNSTTTVGRRRFLRVTGATTTAALGIAALGGQAAAHFEETLDIDVKPGEQTNRIDSDGYGIVPVAVHQTDDFDPTSRDVRYRFGAPDVVGGGGARPIRDGFATDVDDDGRAALVLLFPQSEAGFGSETTEVRLVWEQSADGTHGLAGTDDVTVTDRRHWWD